MIKKKFLALGISAVAATAVVGAGFAGWTFTTEAGKSKNVGVRITAAYSFGSIEIATGAPDTLVLDQGDAAADVTKGVYLANGSAATTPVTELSATWTVNSDSYTASAGKLTYVVNVYVNAALSAYVNCGTKTAETTSAKTGYTQYSYAVTPATSDIVEDMGMNTTAVTIKQEISFNYVTGKKPQSFGDYKTMVNEIQGTAVGSVSEDTEYDVTTTETATDAPVIIEFKVTKATS